jgi:tetratricopeptide (TPR) repeat protein
LKDFGGSLFDFNKALYLDPNLSDAYLNRGITKTDMRDYEGAISDFNMTLNLDDQSGEAYYYRGSAYSKINKQEAALKDWEEARKLGFREPIGEK